MSRGIREGGGMGGPSGYPVRGERKWVSGPYLVPVWGRGTWFVWGGEYVPGLRWASGYPVRGWQ